MELVFTAHPRGVCSQMGTSTPGDLGRRRGLERNAQVKTQKRQCGGAFGAVLRRSCSPSESPRSDVSCVYNVNTATGRWLLCRTRRLPTWPCAAPGACLHGLVPAYMALCRTRRLPTWPCAARGACLPVPGPTGTWACAARGACTRCLPTTTTYYYHEPACLAYLAYLNYLALSPLASALGILLSN